MPASTRWRESLNTLQLKVLMKKQSKMVFRNIKSKYPSLMKNEECKEGENKMAQWQQEGQQCYLIRNIGTFQNRTQGKRQGFEPRYKMKFSNTWSIRPRVCDRCCPSGSPGNKHWNSHHHDFQQWMKVQRLRGHPDSIVTASTHVEKTVWRFRANLIHHQETNAQPCIKMSCIFKIL